MARCCRGDSLVLVIVDQALPLVTLLLGFLLRGEYVRFSERGRLPEKIDRQLAIYEKLPDSPSRVQLRDHIELQVRYLVPFETPATVGERHDKMWGYAIVVTGLLTPGIGISAGWPLEWVGYVSLFGALVTAAGLAIVTKAQRSRNERRWARLAKAERRAQEDTESDKQPSAGAAPPAAEQGHAPTPGRRPGS
jgi:hypothetical protein